MTDARRQFTLIRTLPASCEAVFAAWTEPDSLGWFFNGTPTDVSVDLRVGGAWRQLMVESPEESYVTGGIYREIVPVHKLVFTWGAVGGWPALDLDRLDDAPLATVLLREVDDHTEMSFTLELPAHLTGEEVAEWFAKGIREGWTETLERLVDTLAAHASTLGAGGSPQR